MRKRLLLFSALVIALLAIPATSQAYLVGIADENAAMFTNPLYQQIVQAQPASQRISRYIAPYDVATYKGRNVAFLNFFKAWYGNAVKSHVQILVAFYHSEITPSKMPSTKTYTQDIQAFFKLFPGVKTYQPWNESNRGNVPRLFDSPTATQAAAYFVAMKKTCHGCQIAGLDVLDGSNIRPTLTYIREFKSAVHKLHSPLPTIWGLHNYSDTNRFRDLGTRAVLALEPGQVWLTETGGVVQFGGAFPNRHGEGLSRASKALSYMFKLAKSNPRIRRLYIFQWSGSNGNARFDAGLLDVTGHPRPGYVVVCKALTHNAKACNVKTVSRAVVRRAPARPRIGRPS